MHNNLHALATDMSFESPTVRRMQYVKMAGATAAVAALGASIFFMSRKGSSDTRVSDVADADDAVDPPDDRQHQHHEDVVHIADVGGSYTPETIIPSHLLDHGHFGSALCVVADSGAFKRGHVLALVKHLDELMRWYAQLQILRPQAVADVEKARAFCIQAMHETSRARTKVMRRLVRMARSANIPLVGDSNRLIDPDLQKSMDDIRKGAEEIVFNTNLIFGDKFAQLAL